MIGTNSDLHDVLRSNCNTDLSSGAKFLDIGRYVLIQKKQPFYTILLIDND